MQAEWTADREPLPHWLEELEDQASAARPELGEDQAASKLEELEELLETSPTFLNASSRSASHRCWSAKSC